MTVYRITVYNEWDGEPDIFLVMASSEAEAKDKMISKGYWPSLIREIYWDDGIYQLRNH